MKKRPKKSARKVSTICAVCLSPLNGPDPIHKACGPAVAMLVLALWAIGRFSRMAQGPGPQEAWLTRARKPGRSRTAR